MTLVLLLILKLLARDDKIIINIFTQKEFQSVSNNQGFLATMKWTWHHQIFKLISQFSRNLKPAHFKYFITSFAWMRKCWGLTCWRLMIECHMTKMWLCCSAGCGWKSYHQYLVNNHWWAAAEVKLLEFTSDKLRTESTEVRD